MLDILNSLNAHYLPIFQSILMILVSKSMVHRALSDKTYLLLGLLSPLKNTEKTCLKRPLSKIPNIGFQGRLSLNAGQKYCRMLQGEHFAILSTFIK